MNDEQKASAPSDSNAMNDEGQSPTPTENDPGRGFGWDKPEWYYWPKAERSEYITKTLASEREATLAKVLADTETPYYVDRVSELLVAIENLVHDLSRSGEFRYWRVAQYAMRLYVEELGRCRDIVNPEDHFECGIIGLG